MDYIEIHFEKRILGEERRFLTLCPDEFLTMTGEILFLQWRKGWRELNPDLLVSRSSMHQRILCHLFLLFLYKQQRMQKPRSGQ
jgi:hypothetical protein